MCTRGMLYSWKTVPIRIISMGRVVKEEQKFQSGVGDAKLLEEDRGIMPPLITHQEGTNKWHSPLPTLENCLNWKLILL